METNNEKSLENQCIMYKETRKHTVIYPKDNSIFSVPFKQNEQQIRLNLRREDFQNLKLSETKASCSFMLKECLKKSFLLFQKKKNIPSQVQHQEKRFKSE